MGDNVRALAYHDYVPFTVGGLCRHVYRDGRTCYQEKVMHVTEPSLGLATTRELLEELAARFRAHGVSALGYVEHLLSPESGLTEEQMAYRTVDCK